ncbi:helix-turn-helix transcriptional regulator [Micromonospora sp. DT47]|uniref:helix-turn-helix transcriptional regulator n=1 Tax=Micromonospora sp. DT47 TaxID=3393431 RepID=UPI003CE71E8B
MPEPPARAGRVVLTGGWPAAHVDALAAASTIVDPAEARVSPQPVDWLLAAAGPGGPMPVLALAGDLRAATSPALRVAVVDSAGHWPTGVDCDVYVAGDVGPGELITALWLGGRGFRVGRPAVAGLPAPRCPAALTVREDQLLQALCAGLSNDRIARQLRISRSTVEFHLTRIFKKLGVTSRAEAIVHVLQRDGTAPLSLP